LDRPDWAPGAELFAGAIMSLALAAVVPFAPISWTALFGAGAAGLVSYLGWFAFTRDGVLFDPVVPALSSGFVFLAGVGQLYSQKRQQVSEIRSAFGRYVSPAVVARLAEHPEQLQLGGQQREVTVMFCDIRSFTTLSEGFTAVELSTFLNEYLSPLTDIILQEEGTVDNTLATPTEEQDAVGRALCFGGRPCLRAERGVSASSRPARRHSEGVSGAKLPRREADGGRRGPARSRRGRRGFISIIRGASPCSPSRSCPRTRRR
jgi:Adenylate and Guanylate cyclase catalytic domain